MLMLMMLLMMLHEKHNMFEMKSLGMRKCICSYNFEHEEHEMFKMMQFLQRLLESNIARFAKIICFHMIFEHEEDKML